MIDDEQSSAGWLTRLVGRVMLQSYVITFCLQAASGAPFPVIRPNQLLTVKIHANVVVIHRECVNNVGGSLTFSSAGSLEVQQLHLRSCRFDANSEDSLLNRPGSETHLSGNYYTPQGVPLNRRLMLRNVPVVSLGLDNKSPTFVNASICLLLGVLLWCTLHKLILQGSHRPIGNHNRKTTSFFRQLTMKTLRHIEPSHDVALIDQPSRAEAENNSGTFYTPQSGPVGRI